MSLDVVWFVIVAVFWTGFFVLEGFDFGVGMLHKAVGRTMPSDELRSTPSDRCGTATRSG